MHSGAFQHTELSRATLLGRKVRATCSVDVRGHPWFTTLGIWRTLNVHTYHPFAIVDLYKEHR